ncbi:MAG: 2-oxo acid dehydrogenase subunit E2 [Chloroflexi bacterium]|nr:2-oxo acid dehydrogenase subunit E2 [Chloroflexota bacterium]
MPFEVVLPRLGWNMETGRLGQWLKQDGERVEAGELLFTVEGDKATQEVEALDSGILRIPPDAPPPGKEVPVGTLLAYLLAPDEELEAQSSKLEAGNWKLEASNQELPAASFQQPASSNQLPTISPRARRVAGELGVDWSGLKGSGRTGRIVERDVRQAAAAQATPAAVERVSPLARRLAAELGVDVDALAARLPGKRIERADIEAEAKAKAEAEVKMTSTSTSAFAPLPPAGAVVPITSVRRIIAERMATSAHTTAALTLTTEADATELVRLRKQLKDDGSQPVPSYNDLLAKLSAQALMENPMVNARFDGDTIVQAATANVGIAVDTERGLLVPVLRDVQAKSLRQIARESASLIEKVRAGRITADELHGGTFTITNLGMFEIDAFTPIINLPECAILGVGRIIPKQVVVDAEAERVAIRQMVFLSLTFDHRLVDGAPAARFLQRVKQYVEKPYLWLVG